MGYFPVYLNLKDQYCVVIGSGNPDLDHEVVYKVQSLLDAEAQVKVISPRVPDEVEQLAQSGIITLESRRYTEGDLKDAFLTISATTENEELSKRVFDEGEAEKTLVNVVDVTALCRWIYPAIVRRGDATVAISTNGKSPAMAKRLRMDLENALPEEYAQLLEILTEVRREVRRRARPKNEAWQEAMDETMDLLKEHKWDEVQAHIMDYLLESANSTETVENKDAVS